MIPALKLSWFLDQFSFCSSLQLMLVFTGNFGNEALTQRIHSFFPSLFTSALLPSLPPKYAKASKIKKTETEITYVNFLDQFLTQIIKY